MDTPIVIWLILLPILINLFFQIMSKSHNRIKYILTGFVLGVVVVLGTHFIKVYTYFDQFVDPVNDKCIYQRNYYWDTETWNFDFNWKCK